MPNPSQKPSPSLLTDDITKAMASKSPAKSSKHIDLKTPLLILAAVAVIGGSVGSILWSFRSDPPPPEVSTPAITFAAELSKIKHGSGDRFSQVFFTFTHEKGSSTGSETDRMTAVSVRGDVRLQQDLAELRTRVQQLADAQKPPVRVSFAVGTNFVEIPDGPSSPK